MSSRAMSPNHREILSAKSTISGNQEYLNSTSGALNVVGALTASSGTNIGNVGSISPIVSAANGIDCRLYVMGD